MRLPEGVRRYASSIGWLFVERMLRLVVTLLTGIYMARYLGDALFGQLNYATGFVGLFFAFSAMGIDEILLRDLVRHPERRDQLLGTAAALKGLGSVVLLLVVLTGTFVQGMDSLTASLVVVIGLSEVLRPFSVIDHWFMSQVRARETVRVQMVQVVVSATVKLALIGAIAQGWMTAREALPWFAWTYVVESLTLSLGYIVLYGRTGGQWGQWRPSMAMAAYMMRQSWPMLIYGVAIHVHARIDQVMIGDMLSARYGPDVGFSEVGQYSVALKMIEALGFVPVIVQKSLAPAVTRAKAQDPQLYAERLRDLYRLMFALFLITALPLFFLAKPLIIWMYGVEYATAGALLSLFAVRLLFTNMGVGKSSFITNEGLFRYSLLTGIVGAAVNIGVNIVLIPRYGSGGAIIATIVSYLASIFLMDLLFPRTRMNLRLMLHGMATFWRFHHAIR